MKRFAIAVCLLAIAGCGVDDTPSGGPIAIEHKTDSREKSFVFAGVEKPVMINVDLEYPSKFGISTDEHKRLTAFISDMFNDGTTFEDSMDRFEKDVYEAIQPATTNAAVNTEMDYNFDVAGRINYSDERYMSYEIKLMGVCANFVKSVYDRQLERALTIDDLVATNDFPKLRQLFRKFVNHLMAESMAKEFLQDKAEDWPEIHSTFAFTPGGVLWVYNNENFGVGGWVDAFVTWEDLKPILKDPSMIPTGRFKEVAQKPQPTDGEDWWDFPCEKYHSHENTPPNPPFDGTNYPFASSTYTLEIPVRGAMSDAKFAALQKFLGETIANGHGSAANIREGINRRRISFWEGCIKEAQNAGGEDALEKGFDILEMEGTVKYQDPMYFCYSLVCQHGCSCCVGQTNVVWNWKTLAPVKIEDVFDLEKSGKELKLLMRKAVVDCLAPDYEGDDMQMVLPDYAKDWPYTFGNFYVSTKGMTWSCDAGEVLIGGKGPLEFTVSWPDLVPYVKSPRKNFVGGCNME